MLQEKSVKSGVFAFAFPLHVKIRNQKRTPWLLVLGGNYFEFLVVGKLGPRYHEVTRFPRPQETGLLVSRCNLQ